MLRNKLVLKNHFPGPIANLLHIRIRNIWCYRECVRNLNLQVQVHPGELWFSKQRALEASKSAGAKGDVPKICGFVHPLHPL